MVIKALDGQEASWASFSGQQPAPAREPADFSSSAPGLCCFTEAMLTCCIPSLGSVLATHSQAAGCSGHDGVLPPASVQVFACRVANQHQGTPVPALPSIFMCRVPIAPGHAGSSSPASRAPVDDWEAGFPARPPTAGSMHSIDLGPAHSAASMDRSRPRGGGDLISFDSNAGV